MSFQSFKFQRDQRGSALIEFVLVLPIVLVLIFGTYNIGYFIITKKRLQFMADSMVEWIASPTLSTVTLANSPNLNAINDAIVGGWILGDFINFSTYGMIKVTGINYQSPNWVSAWQTGWTSTTFNGQIGSYSLIGSSGVGSSVSLPATISSSSIKELICVEVYYQFQPVIPGTTYSFAYLPLSVTSAYAIKPYNGSGLFTPMVQS